MRDGDGEERSEHLISSEAMQQRDDTFVGKDTICKATLIW